MNPDPLEEQNHPYHTQSVEEEERRRRRPSLMMQILGGVPWSSTHRSCVPEEVRPNLIVIKVSQVEPVLEVMKGSESSRSP